MGRHLGRAGRAGRRHPRRGRRRVRTTLDHRPGRRGRRRLPARSCRRSTCPTTSSQRSAPTSVHSARTDEPLQVRSSPGGRRCGRGHHVVGCRVARRRHASLVSTGPSTDSVVDTVPEEVTMTFTRRSPPCRTRSRCTDPTVNASTSGTPSTSADSTTVGVGDRSRWSGDLHGVVAGHLRRRAHDLGVVGVPRRATERRCHPRRRCRGPCRRCGRLVRSCAVQRRHHRGRRRRCCGRNWTRGLAVHHRAESRARRVWIAAGLPRSWCRAGAHRRGRRGNRLEPIGRPG